MTTDLSALRDPIEAVLRRHRIPGATIGILRHGSVAELAFGVKDVGTGEPVSAGTIFQCGSLSKSWTALAVMQLVATGRLDLDAPVRTYIPDFRVADPVTSARLTARHLLNHTSGIEEAYGDPGEEDDVYARMVAGIADAPQVSPIGETHGYSAALGYAILARLMEVIEGRPWDSIMADRLFRPMGLTSTSSSRAGVDLTRAATGHLLLPPDGDPVRTPVDYLPRSFGPGGNISSTAREVLSLAHVYLHGGIALNGAHIVPAAAIVEMTDSRVPVPDPYSLGPEWALGLIVFDWHGRTVYGHDGSTIGQNARLRMLPDEDLAIVLLTNGGQRDSLYREVFNLVLAELTSVTIPDLPRPDRSIRIDPSMYTGVYERPGSTFEVSAEKERLEVTVGVDPMHAAFMGVPERVTYQLLPIDGTHFLMPPVGPLEDPQTVSIFDFGPGPARYLHINSRLHPRGS